MIAEDRATATTLRFPVVVGCEPAGSFSSFRSVVCSYLFPVPHIMNNLGLRVIPFSPYVSHGDVPTSPKLSETSQVSRRDMRRASLVVIRHPRGTEPGSKSVSRSRRDDARNVIVKKGAKERARPLAASFFVLCPDESAVNIDTTDRRNDDV